MKVDLFCSHFPVRAVVVVVFFFCGGVVVLLFFFFGLVADLQWGFMGNVVPLLVV